MGIGLRWPLSRKRNRRNVRTEPVEPFDRRRRRETVPKKTVHHAWRLLDEIMIKYMTGGIQLKQRITSSKLV